MTTNVIGSGLPGGHAASRTSRYASSGPGERAIRRVDDDERNARNLALECLAHPGGIRRIVGDVDGPDVVVDRATDVHRLDRRPVDAVDRHDDPLLPLRRRNDVLPDRPQAGAATGRIAG